MGCFRKTSKFSRKNQEEVHRLFGGEDGRAERIKEESQKYRKHRRQGGEEKVTKTQKQKQSLSAKKIYVLFYLPWKSMNHLPQCVSAWQN